MENVLVHKHYNNDTKIVFNFLSEFMTNKFYNVVYELSKKYSERNGLSLSINYKNIFDSFMDTLIITSKKDENDKNINFNLFLNHLYECYKTYISSQLLTINEFIVKVNTTFLPNNYKNETYIQNKENLSILFHTLIYTLSKELYEYIMRTPGYVDIIISNRIPENILVIQRECIKILSTMRNDLFEKFKQQDENISNYCIENNVIENSVIYLNLKKENEILKEQIKVIKTAIIKMIKKENYYKSNIEKLVKLINILNLKEKIKEENVVEDNSAEVVDTEVVDNNTEVVVDNNTEVKADDLEIINETFDENDDIISNIKSDLESLFTS